MWLAGNTQGRAVLHQPNVVDIRHLGTADALIDPAHHVAENALGVVIQLLLNVMLRPVQALGPGDREEVVEIGVGPRLQFRLPRRDIRPGDSG